MKVGIFDSGLGGLSVVKEILRAQPLGLSIIYFADTFHLPYGPRPVEQIKGFALSIIDFLVNIEHVDLIIMGCNISSGVALQASRQKYSIPIIGLIEPAVIKAIKATNNFKIGVIATEGTVKAGFYLKEVNAKAGNIKIYQQACPKLVDMIERNILAGETATKSTFFYLYPLLCCGIDTLILGCSHYALIKPLIRQLIGAIKIIDPAEEVVAEFMSDYFNANPASNNALTELKLYATGSQESLITVGSKFLGQPLNIQHIDFW